MSFLFDFVVRNAAGDLVLAVEAKAKLGTDAAWAQEMRSRITSRSPIARSMALLLVTPDRMYVWRAEAASDTAPVMLDSSILLATHFARVGVQSGRPVDAQVFEEIVHWWLQDLATGVCEPPIEPNFDPVTKALKGGRLLAEIAA